MKKYLILILVSGTILSICMGIRQSFGLYLTLISQDLGLGRETFALSMALLNLVWGLAAPLTGAIADRYGAKFVVLFGALIYAFGLYLISQASSSADLLTAGVVIGFGIAGTGFTAILGAAGRAVPAEKRTMILGLVAMGGSIGQFAALPLAYSLIGSLGWAQSLLILAIIATSMALFGFALGKPPQPEPDNTQNSALTVLRQALSYKSFILLTAGFWVCGFHIAFVAVHLPAFLQDKGFTPAIGATALAIVGFFNIIGTYFFGWVGQHVQQHIALTVLYLARSAIFIPFLFAPLSEPVIWLLSATLGFLWLGTIPLTSGLAATMFGPKWMSMLFGIIFLSHQVGSFFGVWLGGRIYDAFQSYDYMWMISIALGLTAAALHWPIKETPAQTASTSPATP